MSLRYEIVPMAGAHATAMATRLRAQDLAEIEATGRKPAAALWRCYRNAHLARAALVEGELAAVWGCSGPLLAPVGHPWLLTAKAIEKIPVAFLREGRREVAAMLELHPALEGFVLASYRGAVRLLEALGFILDEPRPMGVRGDLFRPFLLRR